MATTQGCLNFIADETIYISEKLQSRRSKDGSLRPNREREEKNLRLYRLGTFSILSYPSGK